MPLAFLYPLFKQKKEGVNINHSGSLFNPQGSLVTSILFDIFFKNLFILIIGAKLDETIYKSSASTQTLLKILERES